MDERLLAMQRQGRIGFYGEAKGQEAAVVGAASALGPGRLDRAGAARGRRRDLSRPAAPAICVAQIFGNANDPALGRQLPCHPGTRAAQRYLTMSSCIATQLPHAVGMAVGGAELKHESHRWCWAAPGDGAIARSPIFAGRQLRRRAQGTGGVLLPQQPMGDLDPGRTSDCVAKLRRQGARLRLPRPAHRRQRRLCRARRGEERARSRTRRRRPDLDRGALVSSLGAHPLRTIPTRYRDETITARWRSERDPIARVQRYLTARGVLDDAREAALRDQVEQEIREAIEAEEPTPPPQLRTMIEDVFAEVPEHIEGSFGPSNRSRQAWRRSRVARFSRPPIAGLR